MLVTERRQTRHVLVADIESLGPELVEGSIHVDRVPQDDGVDDQAKGAELILLALAVALAQFTALAVEDNAGELVTALAAVELVEDTAAVGFVVDRPAGRAS